MIGRRTRFGKMTIFLYGEVQPQRKSRYFFFIAHALITREIKCSRDAQCKSLRFVCRVALFRCGYVLLNEIYLDEQYGDNKQLFPAVGWWIFILRC